MADIDSVLTKWKEFGLSPDYTPIAELLQYVKNTPNPHKHRHKDIAAIQGSIRTSGYKVPPLLWKNPRTGLVEVVIGCGRIQGAAEEGLEGLPTYRDDSMSEAQVKALRLADNRVKDLSNVYDDGLIVDILKDLKFADIDLDYLKYDQYSHLLVEDLAASDPLFSEIAPGYEEQVNGPKAAPMPQAVQPGSQEPNLHPPLPPVKELANENAPRELDGVPKWHGRPNLAYPTDNEYGIPTLSLKYMADNVPKPIVKWGELSRNDKRPRTLHFWVEDEKFEGLLKNPNAPLMGGAIALVEPNFSLHPDDPLAVVLWYTYWKRWLARYWQSKGAKIIVDLWVPGKYSEINLMGVPQGWRAYGIRGNTENLKYVEVMYLDACERADTDELIYLVYGGGQEAQRLCEEYKDSGWIWIPERMQIVSNPNLAGMDGLENKVAYDDFKGIKR
ncbi:MAG: hypothetical protein A4E48_00247 [Methanosaeta sp. PtaU1.Bin060]|nr:MAG: hypothetical protein A4E48_00247 [Methanosaeta sp. PtaU1.Bin060]